MKIKGPGLTDGFALEAQPSTIATSQKSGQVAGAANEKPRAQHAHRPKIGLPNMRSP